MKYLICFLIGFVSLISYAQEKSYSFKENMTAASLPFDLSIASFDGDIELIAGQGNGVEIQFIVRKGREILTISRAELEQEFIVEQSQTSNSLRISVKSRMTKSFHFNNKTSVNFRIVVPQETICNLRTSDGNVAVSGTKGSIHVKSSDGNIKIQDTMGPIESATSDGNILLSRVKGDIKVSTSDGDISFDDVSGSFNGVTSDGNIRGNLTTVVTELTAKTSDGNIDVTVPDHLGLDLNIHGESLSVPLANFTGTSNETSIHGKSNGGGIAVTLSTSDGNVRLKYL